MAGDKQNLQETFLNHVRKTKVPVTIFLINGVKLQGVVSSFDNFSLLLRRDGHIQLVYKHAVSTVMPSADSSMSMPLAFQKRVLFSTRRSCGAAMKTSTVTARPSSSSS